ncbi:DNA repair protein [Tropicibacter sp. R16_0]|uniref:DNA repair protein n=1 Tax=Tropicibacter sp. R16_0 TaxID=2821102 RepID=UPI002571243B|nr:DNA repair protein [Tropicibacter sp. R16_0]
MIPLVPVPHWFRSERLPMSTIRQLVFRVQALFIRLAFFLICIAAFAGVLATLLSATGVWPWLSLQAGIDGQMHPQAGIIAQIGLTCLAVMLAFYLPANGRILALERSHRDFHIQMEDVARAYHAAHAADRADTFQLASEFDAVKDRLAFLREHPELGDLEPEVLELAAQMSQVSHELADIYSDAKVDRARTFLRQRQEEMEQFNTRLDEAKIIMHELRQWTRDVEIDESVAKSQLSRLREELFELLPELSAQLQSPPDGTDPDEGSVVPLQSSRSKD